MLAFTFRRTPRLRAVLILLALLLAACSSSPAPTSTATGKPGGTPDAPSGTANPVIAQGQDKIGNVFLQLLAIYQSQGLTAATQYATDQGLLTTQGEVRATLTLDGTDSSIVQGTALAVGRLGGRVTSTYDDRIELVMPAQALLDYGKRTNRTSFFHDLADFAHVRTVERTPISELTGSVPDPAALRQALAASGGKTEGIAITGADTWEAAGITGKGVKVGILDLGFNSYKQFLGNANVTAKSFRSDGLIELDDPENIHGTACAEIVNELAPDAELFLAAFQTNGEFGTAVNWLVNTVHVDVISDSTGIAGAYPTDGTSRSSKAVDTAKAAGVFFAISAGNDAAGTIGSDVAEGHYGAVFADSDRDGFHDFTGGKRKNTVALRAGGSQSTRVILSWDDWAKPHINYDLFLYDSTGKEVARSDDDQTKGFSPVEVLSGKLPKGEYTLKVQKVKESDPDVHFDLFFEGVQLELTTPERSLSVPADAKGGYAVAAIDAKTGVLRNYSSRGPTIDGRKKPDIGAPSHVSSFAAASTGQSVFTGTSAAAPHLAGAAALYKQAFTSDTPDAMFAYFAKHAKTPKGASVGDNITGAGVVFLDAVPQGASATPVATKTPTPTRVPGTAVPTSPSTRAPATATRTAVSTASRATATAPVPTVAAGNVVFTDDFSSSASGLPSAGYRNGEYHTVLDAADASLAVYPKAVVDAPAERYRVDAHRVSGAADAGMGLVVRWTDDDNWLAFVVWNDGSFGVFADQDGSIAQVSGPGNNRGIKINGTNMLEVSAVGNQFTFAANGQVLVQIALPAASTEGAFGFVGVGGDSDGADIAFDNYQVALG